MKIDLLDYSDFDILQWHWICPRCKARVGQDKYPWKEIPKNHLICCKCLTEIKVLSKRDSGRRRELDIIYEAEVEMVRSPTRLELLQERDSHAAHLKQEMERCRTRLLEATTGYQPGTKAAQELLRLSLEYDKHLIAYRGYLAAVGE